MDAGRGRRRPGDSGRCRLRRLAPEAGDRVPPLKRNPGRLPPLHAQPMRTWTTRANPGATLALLLLIPALVAGTRLRPAAAIAAGFESNELDDLNGTIAARTAKPPPSPLILAELSPKTAPFPSGPVTSVPILYYHYIPLHPHPRDR